MNISLRLFLMVVSALLFFFVMRMLVRKNLNETNSVMWFVIAFFTLVSGFFPDIIAWLSNLVGIDYPPAFLFLLAIITLMIIIFKNSIELSKADAKINEIASILAILKEENKRLKLVLNEITNNDDALFKSEE